MPVTVIQAGPCHVLQLRTAERDGYEAVQLGFLDKPRRLASRSQRGHVAKLDSKRLPRRAPRPASSRCPRPIASRNVSFASCAARSKGSRSGRLLDVDSLAEVKRASMSSALPKGRGTAGVMVRHNFKGQRATHGVKKVHRHAGSIGQSQFPGHVPKGRRMAGQSRQRAQHDAQSEASCGVDAENNLLLVGGAVPGPNGGYVMIQPNEQGVV